MMMMKQEEAIRLANECVPRIIHNANGHDHQQLLLLNAAATDIDNDDCKNEKKKTDGSGTTILLEPLTKNDVSVKRICNLWGGMGAIYQLNINLTSTTKSKSKINSTPTEVIKIAVKHIPSPLGEPNSSTMSHGDCRKSHAYQVEANFYQHFSATREIIGSSSSLQLRVPQLYYLERQNKSITLCLEWIDTNTSGGGFRENDVNMIKSTLEWLGTFHALSWGNTKSDKLVEKCGLQPIGSYWHLETRREEHNNMPRHKGWEGRLRKAASAIHSCLQRDSLMQCVIHGDFKAENILVVGKRKKNSEHNEYDITMCDYQYCGKGPPTKDLAYFFCSSVDVDDDDEYQKLLRYYYEECLVKKLQQLRSSTSTTAAVATENNIIIPSYEHFVKSMDLAYADFCRFLCGWGYWGDVPTLQNRTKDLLQKLDRGKDLGSEQAYEDAIRGVYW